MCEADAALSVQDFVQCAINLLRNVEGRAGSIFGIEVQFYAYCFTRK
jgi:hypothetical protein